MPQVFEQSRIGNIRLKNRIIRSATGDGLADPSGRPTAELIEFYTKLARGGAGAIITGLTGIQQDGKSSTYHPLMLDQDEFVADYRKLTDAVHLHDTPVIIQLNHSGRQTRQRITGKPTVAPSARRDLYFLEKRPKALSEKEIETIIENFVKAIVRAKQSGFDGVQLHLAHGFLLSAFLSSNTNRRTDQWGGSLTNKFRIIERILAGATKEARDFPILAKMNAFDNRKNGMRIPEAIEIAKLLEQAGCAAIEISCGMVNDGFITVRSEKFPTQAALRYSYLLSYLPGFIKKVIQPFVPLVSGMIVPLPGQISLYNVEAAGLIRKNVSIPVIVVGGIRHLDDIEDIITHKRADYVSMSRAFIIEPDIVNRFKEKKQTRSSCIACNYCITCMESMPFKCFYGKLK